jgi:hypothetical protein
MCVWFDYKKVIFFCYCIEKINNKHLFVLNFQPWFVEISFENETMKGWWKCMWSLFQ